MRVSGMVVAVALALAGFAPVGSETRAEISGPVSLPKAPAGQDNGAVLELARAYFAALDRDDWSAAWGLFSPGFQGNMPLERFSANANGMARDAGPRTSLRFSRLTWYENPPGAPRPGQYAVLDYAATYEDGGFVCGYLVAVRWSAEPIRLMTYVNTHAPGPIVAKSDAQELARIRRESGCVA